VRQIVVLQQELLGNRPVAGVRAVADMPVANAKTADAEPAHRETEIERNDLPDRERPERDDLYDHDDRAYGEVVADVRQVLGVSPVASEDFPAPAPHKPFKPRPYLTASASPVGANARERGPPSA
jgi:hypothetical protein